VTSRVERTEVVTERMPGETSPVPLVDLGWQRDQIADDVRTGWDSVLARTAFVGGPDVSAFEEEYADYLGSGSVVGTANGTDALEVALRALGLGEGDEVIIPANTFIATAEAVRRAGATVVFADVDEDTLLIDPASVETAVTARTRAVIPVHLFGQMAPVEAIRRITDRVGALVIEDAAQSQGATRHGLHAGTLGDASGTSFYPGKNLGAFGDAGAVMTPDAEVARRCRLLTQHGSLVKYDHEAFGFNSRLDTMQAVVLRAKLRRLDEWNTLRAEAAAKYDQVLAQVPGVRLPMTLDGNVHAWHLYVIRVEERDRVLGQLNSANVGAGIHYPVPISLTPAFRTESSGPGAYPVAEAAASAIVSLPLYPGISADQQERVVDVLEAALAG
jgi:dTDP-4-amino-4,6-dideoxygalactose transaminase